MTKIVAYKGFDAQLRCRDYQFETGKTFKHEDKVIACDAGFHACEYPLDVFGYYPPASSRYGEVELAGETAKKGDDTKIAAAEITIKAELKIPEIVAAAVRFIKNLATEVSGDRASGEREIVTVKGDRSVAAVTGHWSAATATGYKGKVRGAAGCALFLVERNDDWEIVETWSGIVGRDGIKPDTFYRLEDGKPVEVD